MVVVLQWLESVEIGSLSCSHDKLKIGVKAVQMVKLKVGNQSCSSVKAQVTLLECCLKDKDLRLLLFVVRGL